MEPGYRRCCGIDVHKDTLTVTVLPPVGRADMKIKRQVYRTFTRNLRRLRGWLCSCRVTDVAMESTGQYWRAVWNILEGRYALCVLFEYAATLGVVDIAYTAAWGARVISPFGASVFRHSSAT